MSNAQKSFRYLYDSEHGWLEVNMKDLEDLGLDKSVISSFSFEKGDLYYLEKDIDANAFIAAYQKENGEAPRISEHDQGPYSRIRMFDRILTSENHTKRQNNFKQLRLDLLSGKWPPLRIIRDQTEFTYINEQEARKHARKMISVRGAGTGTLDYQFEHDIAILIENIKKLNDKELQIILSCLELNRELRELELDALLSVGYHIAKKAQDHFRYLLSSIKRPRQKKFLGISVGESDDQKKYNAIERACLTNIDVRRFRLDGAAQNEFHWHLPKGEQDLLGNYLKKNFTVLLGDHDYGWRQNISEKVKKYDFKIDEMKVSGGDVYGTDYKRFSCYFRCSFNNVPNFFSVAELLEIFHLWNGPPQRHIQNGYIYYVVKNEWERRVLPLLR